MVAGSSDGVLLDVPLAESLASLLERVRERDGRGDREGALALLDGAPDATALQAMGSFHFTRGALLFRLDRIDEAVAALERAVALEPEVAEVEANLGAALFERARRGGALGPGPSPDALTDLLRASEVLERAASRSPRLPAVWSNLGLVRAVQGREAEALAAFDRALALAPEDVPTLYNRAAALSQLGQLEECVRTLDRILRLDPHFAPALQSRENTLQRIAATR